MWGFARHGVVPDLVTMGKPMGNGHPVAAMVAKPELLRPFGAASRYFNTFGGNSVSMAVARTVLDVIADEGLMANAARTGDALRRELALRSARDGRVGEVRGCGLFIGMDVLADKGRERTGADNAALIVNGLRERGVLISASGPAGDVLKIRPPLVFTQAEADVFLAAFDDVLARW